VTDSFDPAPAAAMLADAWQAGTLLSELPAAIRPNTMADGYDIQDRLVARVDRSVAGWKLGVGSAAQKRQSGVGRSIAGRIFASHLYRAGDTLPLPNIAPVTVEFEIAYVLARDVRPDEPDFPILEAVAEIRVAFEIVRSRFVDRRAVGWPSFAADNGAFQALVLGDLIPAGHIEALADSLVVSCDGKEVARRLTGDDVTDPMAALADLAAIARERAMMLPKGTIVSTGTVSKPFDLAAPSTELRARFLDQELGLRTRVNPGSTRPT
jgi:2-keto-4-pentenoate hydratase